MQKSIWRGRKLSWVGRWSSRIAWMTVSLFSNNLHRSVIYYIVSHPYWAKQKAHIFQSVKAKMTSFLCIWFPEAVCPCCRSRRTLSKALSSSLRYHAVTSISKSINNSEGRLAGIYIVCQEEEAGDPETEGWKAFKYQNPIERPSICSPFQLLRGKLTAPSPGSKPSDPIHVSYCKSKQAAAPAS